MNKELLQQYRKMNKMEKADFYTHQLDKDFIITFEIPTKSISSDIDEMNP